MGRTSLYLNEFKESAVKLITDLGYIDADVATKLGCSAWSIRQWEKQFYGNKERTYKDFEAGGDAKKLREENARLRMENGILKKVAAYFAKESL